ncbi:MAG: hypothetical protein ACYS6K_07760 [Planctomycetota bacterium]
MRSMLISGLIATVILCTTSTLTFGWGAATHTYLAKELGSQQGIMNLQEMYGAVLPDMFNMMFGYSHKEYLWNETHYEFMKAVKKANILLTTAFVYGFASHNEDWGADDTAHGGYVTAKTDILSPLLKTKIKDFLDAHDISLDPILLDQLASRIAHNAIESAVDLLVSQNEAPDIGMHLLLAAKSRAPSIPQLLIKAYSEDFAYEAGISFQEASVILVTVESQFEEYMELYGGILAQANAADLMAVQGAKLAELILQKEYGISVNVPPLLMKFCLYAAVMMVQNDYSDELATTLSYVEEELEKHGIRPAYF